MKTIKIEKFGGPEVLEIQNIEIINKEIKNSINNLFIFIYINYFILKIIDQLLTLAI